LFERIKQVLEKYRGKDEPNYFFLADSIHGRVSSVKRVLKNYPELVEYEFDGREIVDKKTDFIMYSKGLSNFSKQYWREYNPNNINKSVPFYKLHEIAKKIPRAYPFHTAIFIFDRINWFLTDHELSQPTLRIGPREFPLSTYLSNAIIFYSNWWISGRDLGLMAAVEIPVPEKNASSLPPLDEGIKKSVELIGKIRVEEIVAAPSEDEMKVLHHLEPRALEIVKQYNSIEREFKERLLESISIPHILPDQFKINGDNKGSRKTAIMNVFKPRGYSYLSKLSGQGIYTLVKRTKSNHQIKLLFDSGKYNCGLACTMVLEAPFWEYRVALPLPYKDDKTGSMTTTIALYPLPDEETLKMVVNNFAVVVDYMEKTFVKEMEELYGPAPNWYEYQI
jgi:hypothetical protein